MEHVVFYPGHEGSPAFRRFGSVDEAVRFVEHLRNVEGVAEVSVHALTPVPVAFRAYYKVELPADGDAVPVEPVAVEQPVPVEPASFDAPAAEPAAVEPVADVAPAVPVQPVPADAAVEPVSAEVAPGVAVPGTPEPSPNGKRTLGFFAH